MEYVPGLPITDYCDNKKLGIRERLELFVQVCEGVQHAHQKAIVHRDLKPANVLVVEVDGKPTPRIIDFGLAKPLVPRGFSDTEVTIAGVPIGTPAYMSPEQADPRVRDVDTRTDVYSLGVILYELLTGTLPFDPKEWQNKPLEFVLRQVREKDPPRPSTQFKKKTTTHREAATAAADMRDTDPTRLVSLLHGDLDWISMKALEKDRARRYGTPSELSADISRYLNDEPVLAGPATTSYRLRKYAVRHRIALGIAAATLLVLAGFLVTQAFELRRIIQERDRATRERDRATRERDRATRITDFMTGIFKVTDPSESRGNTITAREILDKASTEIDAGLTKDPELQAQMMAVMGDVYYDLGLYSRAQSLQQHAIEIQKRVVGPENPETLRSMHALASTLNRLGHLGEAEALQRQAFGVQQHVLGPDNPDTLMAESGLANILHKEGHDADAEKLQREALEVRRRVLGPEDKETLRSMVSLGNILENEGRFAEEETIRRQTLEIQTRVFGRENVETLFSIGNLGNVLAMEGNFADAEKLHRESLEIRRRVQGPEHPDTLAAMSNLAEDLSNEGRYAESAKLHREVFDIRRRVLGRENPETLESADFLARVLSLGGKYAESEKIQRETLEAQKRVLGPENPDTLASMSDLSENLVRMHEYAEAERVLTQALEIQRRVLGPDSPDAAISTYDLGSIAAHRGQRDSAFSLLNQAVDHGLPPDGDLVIDKDADLTSLHGDPRFAALIAHAKEKAAAARKPK